VKRSHTVMTLSSYVQPFAAAERRKNRRCASHPVGQRAVAFALVPGERVGHLVERRDLDVGGAPDSDRALAAVDEDDVAAELGQGFVSDLEVA
jgi:hypothetical protein